MEVAPLGFAMLDMIVVSLVYVESERRRGDPGSCGFGVGGYGHELEK